MKLAACVLILSSMPAVAEKMSSSPAAEPATQVTPTLGESATPVAPPPVPAPPPPVWSGDFSFGYVKTSGNANASTLNVKGDVDFKSDPWENTLSGTAFKANSDGVNTDEKYSIGNKLLFNLDPKEYLFGQVNYDDDRYGAITERYSGALGYGRHFLKTPRHTLDIDIGLGANRTREQGDDNYRADFIGTFDGVYLWKISNSSQFKQTLRTEFGGKNTFVNPVSELKLTIIKNFFATLGYELRYNSTTASQLNNPTGVGTYHTDQITTVNLGYTFGKPAAAAP